MDEKVIVIGGVNLGLTHLMHLDALLRARHEEAILALGVAATEASKHIALIAEQFQQAGLGVSESEITSFLIKQKQAAMAPPDMHELVTALKEKYKPKAASKPDKIPVPKGYKRNRFQR